MKISHKYLIKISQIKYLIWEYLDLFPLKTCNSNVFNEVSLASELIVTDCTRHLQAISSLIIGRSRVTIRVVTRSFSTLAAVRSHSEVASKRWSTTIGHIPWDLYRTRCTRFIIKARLCNSIQSPGTFYLVSCCRAALKRFREMNGPFHQRLHFLCKVLQRKRQRFFQRIKTVPIYSYA